MHHLRHIIRKVTLYVSSIVLIGAMPITAFADSSDACAGTGHWSDRWATDPTTNQCVKLYDSDGTYVGPPYMVPQPSPSPTPAPSPSPAASPSPQPPTPDVTIPQTTVQDSGSGNTTGTDTTTTGTANTDVSNATNVDSGVQSTSQSGSAKVQGNQSGGNATSGDANTNGTVVNSVHSTVGGGSGIATFTYDVNGNVVGDITLNGSGSQADTSSSTNLKAATDVNNKTNLNNDVNLDATSGTATVQGNESKGSATTGSAQTNLTILNLTGHQVTAANSLLVFVNVLGTWVGMIVDAPGATAAMLGSGVISSTTTVASTANLANSSSITNTVTLAAKTGNALVSGNESGGNATSGSATASANIANISTSTFNLSGWFGVLYINVFGKWLGSFGINTSAGTVQPLTGMAVSDPTPTVVTAPSLRFGFTPHTSSQSQAALDTATDSASKYPEIILASAKTSGHNAPNTSSTMTPIASPHDDPFSILMMVGGFGAAGASSVVWAIRRLLAARGGVGL